MRRLAAGPALPAIKLLLNDNSAPAAARRIRPLRHVSIRKVSLWGTAYIIAKAPDQVGDAGGAVGAIGGLGGFFVAVGFWPDE